MPLQGLGVAPSPGPAAAAASACWQDIADMILMVILMIQMGSYLVCSCIEYCFKGEVPQDQLQAHGQDQQAPQQDVGRGLWYRWRSVIPVAAVSASTDEEGPAAPGNCHAQGGMSMTVLA